MCTSTEYGLLEKHYWTILSLVPIYCNFYLIKYSTPVILVLRKFHSCQNIQNGFFELLGVLSEELLRPSTSNPWSIKGFRNCIANKNAK